MLQSYLQHKLDYATNKCRFYTHREKNVHVYRAGSSGDSVSDYNADGWGFEPHTGFLFIGSPSTDGH